MRERSDELAELAGRQPTIAPAVSRRQIRLAVVRAQHHLERPGATHKTCQVLNTTRAGDQAEPLFRLTEDRRLSRGKAHIAGQHELATGAAHASLNLCDG